MKKRPYILLLWLLVLLSTVMRAQPIQDTLCLGAGPSNFAVPYQPGLKYHWTVQGGSLISTPADSNDIRVAWGNVPGIHEVSVYATNEYGCPGDTSRYRILLESTASASGKGPTRACSGQEVTFETTLKEDFVWQGGEQDRTITFVAEGDTSIYLVALNTACGNDTVYYHLDVMPDPEAGMNYTEDSVITGTSIVFYFTGGNAQQITWYHNDRKLTEAKAVHVEFNEPGEHEILQIVSNGHCTDTIVRKVYVSDVFTIFIPNAFTPNGDGVNDYFTFDGVGIESFEAEIFNRWGERIFRWNESSPVQGWDGTNSGQPSKMDAYIYKIRVRDISGQSHFYTAQFSLIR